MVRHKRKAGRRRRELGADLGKIVGTAVLMAGKGHITTILTMREHHDRTYSFEKVEIVQGAIHASQLRDYNSFRAEVRKLKRVYGRCVITDNDSSATMIAPVYRF